MSTPDDVKARVASAYNSAADYYDHSANSFWDRYGRQTIGRLRIAPASTVLDLCCGSGASALPAAEAVGPRGRVVAVDLARDLVALGMRKAEERGLKNVDFRVGDILEADLGSKAFDYVTCVFGVFFIPDMEGAIRRMWDLVGAGGQLSVTTWGKGLFEPLNSAFWEGVRSVRPELFKSFNPWDRIGDPDAVRQLFADASLPRPVVVLEPGEHPIQGAEDALALMMGSGYRGVLEQLSSSERTQVLQGVASTMRSSGATSVRTDVIFATCTKELGSTQSA